MTEQSRAGRERSCGKSVVFSWALILSILCVGGLPAPGAVDLVLSGTDSPDPVITLSNLTYTLTFTNVGSTTATDVTITNFLSSRLTFLSATNTRGTCTNNSGVVRCDCGNLSSGTGGRITIVARPTAPGIITNVAVCVASEVDANPSNNSLVLTTTAVNRRAFGNSDFIQLDDVVANTALPYPSTINVSGLTTAVYKVTCTLSNVSHSGPDDLDILLMAPNGGYVMLLSDGPISPGMTDVTITFDDAAAQFIPDTGPVASGSYKPANYGNIADIMPAPAPAGPHLAGFTPLSVFNGINPNGDWRLYVYDDEPEAGGWIDGWSLTLLTSEPMANVGVMTTNSPTLVVAGGTVTYTSTVTNLGPVNATGVRLTNQLPVGFQVISITASRGSCTNESGTIRCDIGALASGASETLTVQARPTNGGIYTNRIDVASDQYDPQLANNTAFQAVFVDPRVDVGIDVTSSRTPALLEQPLIYTLAVTNLGPDPATGVRMVDQLPPGVLLVNFSASQGSCTNQAGVVTCNLGTVPSQGRATVFFTCRPTVLGPITNIATISADQADSVSGNNTAQNINTVDPAADLVLSISDTPDPLAVTQPITYSILVTNRGPNIASNIVISDNLPATLRLVSVQTTRGACTNDGNAVSCTGIDLTPAERVTVTIVATAASTGTVVNTPSVIGQPTDPNVVNNTASATTQVLPAVDISVTKSSDRSIVWEGDRMTYSFIVTNNGPSTATGARLNDPLPPGVSFNSASASAGACGLSGITVVCSFGDMLPGAWVTATIVVTANNAGSVTNIANALANEQDLNPGNNTAPLVTTIIPKSVSRNDATPIVVPDIGVASLYPASIDMSGATAAVQRVRVTLAGLSHTYPDDLDILLVGPGGQAVVVMSDAGGSTPISNISLPLDDLASLALPDNTPIVTPPYRPADYEVANDEFPAPAPAGPYASSFDAFAGTDPNGTWKLYVLDDQTKDQGMIANGWRLDIWTRDPLADLSITGFAEPALVAVGSNVTFRIAVSNNGPATATAVTVTNAFGPDLAFVSAMMSQGSCSNAAGLLQCTLGDLAAQNSAFLDLSFRVLSRGSISNAFGVATTAADTKKSNNVSVISFAAENPPTIVTQPRSRFVPNGSNTTFLVVADGDPPLSYQWFYNDAPVIGATGDSLTITDVQPEKYGDYRVQISNRVGAVLSIAAHLGLPRPPTIDLIADQLMDEDTVLTVPLAISDPDDPFEIFQLAAACGDTNLVPTTNFTFVATGTNYLLVFAPGTNQFGTNTVTVTATDSTGLSASGSFVLGVQSVNDYPQFVVPVGDQVINEDGLIDVPFVIGDVETEADQLITGARIYNPNMLVGISLFGSGSNRVIRMGGVQHSVGVTTVELRLRDEAGVRTTNFFTLTILPIPNVPTISRIADLTIGEDSELMVAFEVNDPDTPLTNLALRAESLDQTLFRDDSFTFAGTTTARTLHAFPQPNVYGTNRITVFVTDESGLVASNTFVVTVTSINDPPFLSSIPAVQVSMNETSAPVSFLIGDLETDPDNLVLTAISTNTTLAPASGVHFGGSGSNRTMSVTPAAGESGWTVLRIQVADADGGVTNQDFELFVHPTNGSPAILDQPANQTVTPGSPIRLRVVAVGPGQLSYIWQRNGQDLAGETNAALTIASATAGDRGEYRVSVTNPEGTTLSAPAQVNVLEGTRILTVRQIGSAAEVTFGTIAKQRYTVEYQDLIGAGWTQLPQVLGTGGTMTVTDPAAPATSRFYRIRVE